MLSFNVDYSLLKMSSDFPKGSAMFSQVLKHAFDFKWELSWPSVSLKKALFVTFCRLFRLVFHFIVFCYGVFSVCWFM